MDVSLRGAGDELRLTVRDDGSGTDPARASERPGLGVVSMRERAHMHGGEFRFRSTPGEGTTFVLTFQGARSGDLA